MTFSADSRWLATRDVAAGQVRVWNPVNGELAKLIQLKSSADNRSTRGFAFSANHLASVDYSRIRVWEAATWREASWPASSVHPLGPFQELRFNHDGSLLVVQSHSEVSVWRLPTWFVWPRSNPLDARPRSPSVQTGHRLASANLAGETQVWDTDKWELLFTTRHTQAVNVITFILTAGASQPRATTTPRLSGRPTMGRVKPSSIREVESSPPSSTSMGAG